MTAGAGADSLDGGPGLDFATADAHDVLRAGERSTGGRRAPEIVPPTAAEVRAATRAAVAASRARVWSLVVRVPERFALTVAVADPAAYLRHRANAALLRILPLERKVHWGEFAYAVRGPSGVVFWSRSRGKTSTWHVRPDLINCATGLAIVDELNPDGVGPPCPAP